MSTTPERVIAELAALASAFGGPRWAQGPGGNVSVKEDGALWIKASGTRLAVVDRAPNHVGVPLADAALALDGDTSAEARVFGATPRPSLETYFHALDGVVVAHTHPISAMLVACAARDLDVAFDVRVPYERPGRGLAISMKALGARREEASRSAAKADPTSMLLLSHGLVVYARSASEAIERSLELDRRCLAAAGADASSFDELVAEYKSAPVEVAGGHAMRLRPRRSTGRYLFPDAVVYASTVRAPTADLATCEEALAKLGRAFVLTGDDGTRIAVAKSASALEACVEICAAHDWVEDVLVRGPGANYLPEDEPAKILGLPSEQHRIRLGNG